MADGRRYIEAESPSGEVLRSDWHDPFDADGTDVESVAWTGHLAPEGDPRGGFRLVPRPPSGAEPAEESAGSGDRLTADELGERLYDCLFRQGVLELFRRDATKFADELCLALEFDPTEEWQLRLFVLPWERMETWAEPRMRSGLRLVRWLHVDREEPAPLHTPRLRVLAVPVDDEGLDLVTEMDFLQGVAKSGERFDVRVEKESPTIQQLRLWLQHGEYHVLHVMGHGRWSAAEQAWGIRFDGHFLTASKLASLLPGEAPELRLIVLNTCHSARLIGEGGSGLHDRISADLGLATALLKEAAVATVAMGDSITDAAAHDFAVGLYERLARAWPLARALQETRKDLYGSEGDASGVREGEWATPMLLVRTLLRSSGGRLFDVLRPWPVGGAVMLAGLGALGLCLFTGLVWLAHPQEILWASGLVGSGAAWLLGRFVDKTDGLAARLRVVASRLGRRAILSISGALLALGVSGWLWTAAGDPRLESLPCLRQAPVGIDLTERAVAFRFAPDELDASQVEPEEAWSSLWIEDFESRLAEVGFQPLPANSPVAQGIDPSCFAWRIEGIANRRDLSPSTRLSLWRRGQRIEVFHEPAAPVAAQNRLGDKALMVLEGRETTFEGLAGESHELNRRALQFYGRGELGRAADLLRDAVDRDRDEAVLRNNLAQVLTDLARQSWVAGMDSVARRPAGQLRDDARELLAEAARHLDQAVRLRPGNARFRYHRARIDWLRGDLGDAQQRLHSALELWPGFPEAANDLAVLELDHPDLRSPSGPTPLERLEELTTRIDPDDHVLLATVLKNLGRARGEAGQSGGALEALDTAGCLASWERLDLRAEVLALTARFSADALGPATAHVQWRRYGALARHDPDPRRRALFFEWQAAHFSWPDTPVDPSRWAARCGRGAEQNSKPGS